MMAPRTDRRETERWLTPLSPPSALGHVHSAQAETLKRSNLGLLVGAVAVVVVAGLVVVVSGLVVAPVVEEAGLPPAVVVDPGIVVPLQPQVSSLSPSQTGIVVAAIVVVVEVSGAAAPSRPARQAAITTQTIETFMFPGVRLD